MCHFKSFDSTSLHSTPTTDSRALPCPICGQPITPDVQPTLRGGTIYLYTCRNYSCESGIREITLDAEQFNTLTLDVVRTYPIPRTAAMKAVRS